MTANALASPINAVMRKPTATVLMVIAALVVFGGVRTPDFLTIANFGTIGDVLIVPLAIGIPVSIALLAGVVDLSIGANVGVSATVFAVAYQSTGSAWWAAAAALGLGLLVGAINSLLAVALGVAPIMATLGTLVALQGVQLRLHENPAHDIAFLPGLFDFVARRVLDVPLVLLILLAGVVVATAVVNWTRLGHHIIAVGGHPVSSARAGIRVGRVQTAMFLLVGLAAAGGGILSVAQIGAAPDSLGVGLELKIYAGILLAGFSILYGGVGSLPAAVLGIIVIAMFTNILNLLSLTTYWSDVATGTLLVCAVYLDGLRGGERFS